MLLIGVLAAGLHFSSCQDKRISYKETEHSEAPKDSLSKFRFANDGKFRGMHIHSDSNLHQSALLPLVHANVEWVVHTPFLVQKNYNSTNIELYDYTHHPSIDHKAYERDLLQSATHCNIKCIVKPLLWLENNKNGEWRGSIRFDNHADWKKWSENYRSIILRQARACEAMGVEAFCIGTELTSIVESQPDFWRKLIKDVRANYSGLILYAANWDREFEIVPFWGEVDYIGISAYFPLSKKSFPSLRRLKRGWKKHLPRIEALSRRFDKQVVFTEVGYRSTAQAATRPWEWVKDAHTLGENSSPATQANCYEALFQSCWDKDWFAGALLWDWKIGPATSADRPAINFTPSEKPAEEVMARWFGK